MCILGSRELCQTGALYWVGGHFKVAESLLTAGVDASAPGCKGWAVVYVLRSVGGTLCW
jgi:hypothetical protein